MEVAKTSLEASNTIQILYIVYIHLAQKYTMAASK